ncbi:acyl--CoA ligase, partial [bacterium]|nr:acyl--CoA ligase [bacterium]
MRAFPVAELASGGFHHGGALSSHGEAEVRGALGQLHVRGPGCLDAYLSPWKPRAEILDADGWFATGDIAKIDAEGFVTLQGRSRAVIGVGGMKFFPEEVESVLTSHPAISAARAFG